MNIPKPVYLLETSSFNIDTSTVFLSKIITDKTGVGIALLGSHNGYITLKTLRPNNQKELSYVELFKLIPNITDKDKQDFMQYLKVKFPDCFVKDPDFQYYGISGLYMRVQGQAVLFLNDLKPPHGPDHFRRYVKTKLSYFDLVDQEYAWEMFQQFNEDFIKKRKASKKEPSIDIDDLSKMTKVVPLSDKHTVSNTLRGIVNALPPVDLSARRVYFPDTYIGKALWFLLIKNEWVARTVDTPINIQCGEYNISGKGGDIGIHLIILHNQVPVVEFNYYKAHHVGRVITCRDGDVFPIDGWDVERTVKTIEKLLK